ncbi:jg17218 [Pararge aegeria aegeria]|uniref:Jg17218 protein n=1 Tax=Pararge aegeria aegeria TaxID=348720 RepID=A0A8S4SDD0_9NEOP|nr:jg17218 [Pararge aegeria aegeria]
MDPRVVLLVVGLALASARYTAPLDTDFEQSDHRDHHGYVAIPSLDNEPAIHQVDINDNLPSGRRCFFGNCIINIKQ